VFTLQFRKDDVVVTSAKVSSDGEYVTVTYSDQQDKPLSEGAGVTFAPGFGIAPVVCVVQEVDSVGKTMNMRVVPVILGFDNVTANPETGVDQTGDVLYPKYKTIKSIWGTDTPGATLKCTTTAKLTPFSSVGNNLGDLFGLGTLKDRDASELGSSDLAAIQAPFGNTEGSVVVTTQNPHFCERGDIIKIENTNSLLDSLHEVKLVVDDTHVQITPSLTDFLASMPQLQIYIDGVDSPATCFDIVESAEVVDASSGTAELLIHMKDKSQYYDMESFSGCEVRFAVDPNFYGVALKPEYAYGTATIGNITRSAGSLYPDKMQLFYFYPSFIVNTSGAKLTRVANAELAQFDKNGTYFPKCLISPARYDFSRRHRFAYVTLSMSDREIGNIVSVNLPGTRIFAKIPLSSGRDAVTFVSKRDIDGTGVLTNTITTLRSVSVGIYNPDGSLYEFLGSEWSLTLEIVCKTPTQQ
jgi:hypothetical protein